MTVNAICIAIAIVPTVCALAWLLLALWTDYERKGKD